MRKIFNKFAWSYLYHDYLFKSIINYFHPVVCRTPSHFYIGIFQQPSTNIYAPTLQAQYRVSIVIQLGSVTTAAHSLLDSLDAGNLDITWPFRERKSTGHVMFHEFGGSKPHPFHKSIENGLLDWIQPCDVQWYLGISVSLHRLWPLYGCELLLSWE